MNSPKNILIFLLLALVAACDKTDITPEQAASFIKFYNTYPVIIGVDVKEIPGVGFAAVGTAESFDAGRQICLIRTDKYGNLVDSVHYYGRSGDDEARCLQVLANGDLAILGTSFNPATSKTEACIIKTDGKGETLLTRYFGGTGNVDASHFEISSSGSFIMVGSCDTVKSGIPAKDIWLFGLQSNGNLIDNWPNPRKIGGDGDDIGKFLQILEDGRIVITGLTRSYPTTTNDHAFVIITNSIGGVIFPYWIDSQVDEVGNCIRVLGNNSYLLIGTANTGNAGTGYDAMLKKITMTIPKPSIDIAKTSGLSGNDYGVTAIAETGGFYILSNVMESTGNYSSAALIKTASDGSNWVYHSYGEGSQMIPGSFIRTYDNGFIMAGTNKHPESNSSLFLIKLKPEGTL